MGLEGPRNFIRNTKESLQDAKSDVAMHVEDIKEAIKKRKEGKIYEHIKDISGTWTNGPVKVDIMPASYAHYSHVKKDLAAMSAFKAKYPKLERALEAGTDEISPLIVGNIDIGAGKEDNQGEYRDYMEGGRSTAKAALELKKDVLVVLKDLASEIKKGVGVLPQADYFMGISRLAAIAKSFGFDTYDLPYDPERKHGSYDLAASANEMAGMSPKEAEEKARRKPITLAVISKKKLLELYG